MTEVEIAGRKIGFCQPCFVVAEAGVNHNGSLEMTFTLVDAAQRAGVDAIKFQTFIAEKVMTADAPKAEYQKQTTGSEGSQMDMIRGLQLSFDSFRQIKEYCDRTGIIFMSTPFDEESADFLADIGVPAFKIPSGEVVNHPFLEHVAGKGRPIIMSTGMCYLGEVDEAVRLIHSAGCDQLVLLHCVTDYPPDASDVNLRAMETMAKAFQLPIGYSDHTLGVEAALAAVALGASVIEKHFTLDRNLPGPDHKSSLEPDELAAMVSSIRIVERAMGNGIKAPSSSEMANRSILRRSLTAAKEIPAGAVVEAPMLTAARPAAGIPPALIKAVVGRRVRHAVKPGEMLSWGNLI